MPSIPGSQTSSSTASKDRSASLRQAGLTVPTASTSYPSSSRTPVSDSRIPGSSSTTSTRWRFMRSFRPCCVSGYQRADLDNESRSLRVIIFHANLSAVLGHDVIHNCQSESRAPGISCEIGQEQFLLILMARCRSRYPRSSTPQNRLRSPRSRHKAASQESPAWLQPHCRQD